MPAFEISAVESNGNVLSVAMTDSAADALERFRGALDQFERVWVTDGDGFDVNADELASLARQENPKA